MAMQTNLPLTLLSFTLVDPGAQRYRYQLEALDGRTLVEEWTFDQPTNPIIARISGNLFRLSEFELQRDWRDLLATLINQYALTSLEVSFSP